MWDFIGKHVITCFPMFIKAWSKDFFFSEHGISWENMFLHVFPCSSKPGQKESPLRMLDFMGKRVITYFPMFTYILVKNISSQNVGFHRKTRFHMFSHVHLSFVKKISPQDVRFHGKTCFHMFSHVHLSLAKKISFSEHGISLENMLSHVFPCVRNALQNLPCYTMLKHVYNPRFKKTWDFNHVISWENML